MAASSSQDDGLEDWERALTGADGYPFIATAICVLVIFAIAVTQGLSERSMTIGTGLLVATGAAFLLWIVAYLATIRHASLKWKLGSLGIIWAFALLTSIWAVIAANTALRYDRAMLDEIEWNASGITLPEHPDRGILSRAAITLVSALNDEQKTQRALLDALQLPAMSNADALAQTPSLLNDCERFGRAKPAVAASFKRTFDADARFRANVEASAIQPAFKQSFLKDLDSKMSDVMAAPTTLVPMINEQLDLTGQACVILARHHWQAHGESMMINGRRVEWGGSKTLFFSDNGDMTAYNAIARRSQTLREQMFPLHTKQ